MINGEQLLKRAVMKLLDRMQDGCFDMELRDGQRLRILRRQVISTAFMKHYVLNKTRLIGNTQTLEDSPKTSAVHTA